MSSTAKAQATQLLFAREATAGTSPSTGWQTSQPNPSGIQNFQAQLKKVARNPLSPNMTPEKGDVVGLDATPSLVHDLNKGWLDLFGPGLLRSVAKVPGNKGIQAYAPTAVTATGYTVAASGDLTAKLLVYARGLVNAANNGLKVVVTGSTGTEIKAAGLVAETVSVAGSAMIEVCGVEAPTAADVQLNSSGNLISTTLDFTTLNLVAGHKIGMRMGTGTNEFGIISATAGFQYATVAATPTANLIQLKWHSFTPAADAATGKAIRLYFGVAFRNVAYGTTDYIKQPAWSAELSDTDVGTAGAAVFEVVTGAAINTATFSLPVEGKIEATLAFVARNVTPPLDVGSRISGPSAAYPALAMEMFDTATDLFVHRILDASGTTVIAAVLSNTITIGHGVTAQKQLATFGAADMNFGNIMPRLEMETFYQDAAVPRAIRNNTEVRYEAFMSNGQGGFAIDMPTLTLENGAKTYAENSPVMMAIGAPGHRDPTTNIITILNVFPYVPRP